jgi:ABC-type lipoprotein release transport system permease subunit
LCTAPGARSNVEVSAAWFQFRVASRARWVGWVAIGLLAGVVAGVVMVAVAGARRTSSSLQRVVVDERVADVLVNPNSGALTAAQWRRLEQLPEVAEFARVEAAAAVPIGADGRPDFAALRSLNNPIVIENSDGGELHTIDRAAPIAGRIPGPDEADALVINETAAKHQHLRVGSMLRLGFFDPQLAQNSETSLPKLRDYTLTVVGIVRPLDEATRAADDPRLQGSILVTRALSRQLADLGYLFGGLDVRLHNPHQLTTFERKAREIAGADVLNFQELAGTLQNARRAIRPYVLALWAFAALAALAGIAVVLQIATRQQRVEAQSHPVVRALGNTRADFVRTGLLRGMFIAAVAVVTAVIIAIAGSPLMPIGPLRILEPHRGTDIDVTVVVLGALVTGLLFSLHGVLTANRSPARAARARHHLAEALASRGASPPVVTGVRFALETGRGDAAIPVRSTVFGVGVAIAALVATLVFAAGLTHFTSTPQMYGWAWTYQIEPSDGATTATLEHSVADLGRDPRVRGAAVAAYAQLTIAGKTIGAIAVQTGRGVRIAEMVSGHEPARADELVLGSESLRSLHRAIGDQLQVNIGGVTKQFTVVGRAVFPRFAPYPASVPTGLGDGAAMTLDGLKRFGALDNSATSPLAGGPFALVDAKPGTSASAFHELAFPNAPDSGLVLAEQRPNYVVSYQHLERTPLALAGLLVVLAIATTVHLLSSLIRRRRSDLGVLRALGFTSRQLRLSVLVQATTVIGLALAVAIPIGVVAGRLLWSATSNWLGISVVQVVPLGAILFVAIGALVIGNCVASVPAFAAGRVNPVEILRSE